MKKYILGVILIIVFGFFAVQALMGSMTPYVCFTEARQTSGTVQVNGYLASESEEDVAFDGETNKLHFPMEDEEGEIVEVSYGGGKPDNFYHAEGLVVIGNFENEMFEAEDLLVECPSRYEEEKAGVEE